MTKDGEEAATAEVMQAPTQMDAATIAAIVSQSVAQAMASMQPRAHQPAQEEKTPWNLQKTLCPEKLDIQTFTRQKFKTWESAFRSFIREANLSDKSWEKQSTAFQTACEAETFKKANSLRLQKPRDQQENFESFMTILKTLVEGTRPMWVARHQFQALKQQSETARQYYSSIAEIAEDCDFSKGFCEDCKQKSVDQMILMKMVFDTKSEEAKKEMLKESNLTLEKALAELESEENVRVTQEELNPQSISRIQRGRSQGQGKSSHKHRSHSRPKHKSRREQTGQQKDKCYNCGLNRHKEIKDCPARGIKCDVCGKMNHYTRVCWSTDNDSSGKPKKMGRIVRSIAKVKQISCEINGVSTYAIPDTGSDWDCMSKKGMKNLGVTEEQLIEPTSEMKNTMTASGSSMEPQGYVNMEIRFGEKAVKKPIVLFNMMDDIILSRDTLEELEVVQIKYKPAVNAISHFSNQGKPPKPPIAPKPAHLKQKPTREKLIEEYKDVFLPREEPFGEEKYIIHLEENAIPCRVTKCRNVPFAYMDKLKEEIKKLTEEKIISSVTEPTEWVNPIVITPKKNSEDIRLCVDFRHLNKYCKREYYTSKTVQEAVQMIQADKAQYFSKFDAKKGYHQCNLDEKSKNLTTFITPFGRYRYERAPFGLNSIPEHYNRRMEEALSGLECVTRVVDDILIYGATPEEHDANVRKFLQRCREQKIRLNEAKFNYGQTEIEFAGVIVTKEGFRPNPELVKAISEFPPPTSVTEMRSFQGTVNQLAPYDSELSKKLEPIRHLLKVKNGTIKLTESELKAFEDVKCHLTSPNTLAFYTPNKPIRVFTDAACKSGFGFVVQQQQPDGTWKPLLCNSRVLTSAEKNYAPIEAEMAALAWALKKAEKFLKGPKSFVVYTDHQPLVSMVNKKRLDEVSNERLRSKLMKISDFRFTVEYIKGSENVAADAFSRHPVSQPDAEDISESDELVNIVRTIQMKTIDRTGSQIARNPECS